VILGIHTPETNTEQSTENVRKKAEANQLKFPIAVDANATNWKRWENRYWPAVYLLDRQGKVRWRWYGELNYKDVKGEEIMRGKIAELLAEK
jgi:predicted transcriptional regulator